MATFVIVHGGWGGGWEWTPVARLLRDRGHDVFTPTLTGLGERAHLGGDIHLADHVEDVLAVFTFEEIRDVILCGHSSSGMVITGAADRIPELLKGLVYVDAVTPADGQALSDLMPGEFVELLEASARERSDGKIAYPAELFLPEGSIPAELRDPYVRRTRPQPLSTLTEPIRLTGAAAKVPSAFIRCVAELDPEADLLGPSAAWAKEQGWFYRELDTLHDPQLLAPVATAQTLHELAGEFSS